MVGSKGTVWGVEPGPRTVRLGVGDRPEIQRAVLSFLRLRREVAGLERTWRGALLTPRRRVNPNGLNDTPRCIISRRSPPASGGLSRLPDSSTTPSMSLLAAIIKASASRRLLPMPTTPVSLRRKLGGHRVADREQAEAHQGAIGSDKALDEGIGRMPKNRTTSGVSYCTIRPLFMMAMRSPRRVASSRSWVTSAPPSCARARGSAEIRLEAGSARSGRARRTARPSAIPADRRQARAPLPRAGADRRRVQARITLQHLRRLEADQLPEFLRAPGDPGAIPAEQVRHGGDVLRDGHMGKQADLLNDISMCRRRLTGIHMGGISSPLTRILPAVGSTNRFTMRMVVVLPHPDGPMSATVSPLGDVETQIVDGDDAGLPG